MAYTNKTFHDIRERIKALDCIAIGDLKHEAGVAKLTIAHVFGDQTLFYDPQRRLPLIELRPIEISKRGTSISFNITPGPSYIPTRVDSSLRRTHRFPPYAPDLTSNETSLPAIQSSILGTVAVYDNGVRVEFFDDIIRLETTTAISTPDVEPLYTVAAQIGGFYAPPLKELINIARKIDD